ncbi:DUF695 domain-containing protein [Rufibacter latericius]|uniref:DUF695 domain-containing protein n=1 Tax=Rufibacter latericius TaxID=2487040 RepID=A0A3M9MVK8_9BACT|nr:DUF695 domain-containing protein [Rufibacter latericius]RNI28963.1 DUF695 domain-containing protein [Rufibacter latericius]
METNLQQPDWEVYFCHIDNRPAFIGLDLNLHPLAPIEGLSKIIEVTVPLTDPQEDGFPGEAEWEPLGDIEDSIADTLETTLGALFVGKTLNHGLRKFYFYADEVLLADHYVAQAMEGFPNYNYEADTWEDPNWETYLEFLFPEPEDLQKIQNGKLLRHLEENGDNPSIARQVDHWIYFKDEASRQHFWRKIEILGFQKVEESFEPEIQETPYKLQVASESKLEEEAINGLVLSLWSLAQEYGAEYDGWETSVETGEDTAPLS